MDLSCQEKKNIWKYNAWLPRNLQNKHCTIFFKHPVELFKQEYETIWPIWTYFDQFGATWTHLEPFDPIWTRLDPFGPIWSPFDLFEPILTYFDPGGPIGIQVDQFGSLWTNLDLFEPIWTYCQTPDLGQGLEFDFTFAMEQ